MAVSALHRPFLLTLTAGVLALLSCNQGSGPDGGDEDKDDGAGANSQGSGGFFFSEGSGGANSGGNPSSGGQDSGAGGSSSGGSNAGGSGAGASTGGNANGAGGAGSLPSFILGADITITLEDEYWGATYTDDGEEKPLETVLKDHGFNFIRIDTFVDPAADGGYAEDKEQAFRSLAQTLILAKRVKDAGLGFLLDLHMSDTWTNPGAQTMPASFSGLSLEQLEAAVHDYVHDTVTALVAADARPDMVQIGNEITNGFLWELGRVSGDNFENFGVLLKAGISAVRDIDPTILVVLHIEKCNNLATSRWWLDGVLGQGVSFDVLGQSCYAAAPDGEGGIHHPGYQGTPSEWQTVFTALASEYPSLSFIIAEYSAEQRAANDVLRSLPNGRGLGSFNWDPTRFYETHPNVPLFSTGSAWNDFIGIPERLGLYDQMAEDYGLR